MKPNILANQRGVMMLWIAFGLGAIIAMAAVGPGFGRMILAASEVQLAADTAALAGGIAMFQNSSSELEAHIVLDGNEIDNRSASTVPYDIDEGYYDTLTQHFIVGGIPRNAVRAIVGTEIQNPFGALIQRPTQFIEKVAYSSLTGLRGGSPTLPIVIGDCYFDPDCFDQSCMPELAQVPSTKDNSAWTAFFTNTNTPNVLSFVPEPCGGGQSEALQTGDVISVANGQMTPVLNAFVCLVDHGITEHLIPIVSCDGQFNQTKEVLGFATIELREVVLEGGEQGIVLQSVFKTDVSGTLGGTNFGAGNLVLVEVVP